MCESPSRILSHSVRFLPLFCATVLYGCVAQQSDLKKSEKDLQQQLAQTRAKQGQELSTLREQEMPQLRGELEKAMYVMKHLYAKQEEHQVILNRLEKLHESDKTSISQRLDSVDLVIGKILLRLEAIEKRLKEKP